MPNEVTSHNDRTLFKVLKVLTKDGAMTTDAAMDIIDRVMDAGILFREPAEKVTRTAKNGEKTEEQNEES